MKSGLKKVLAITTTSLVGLTGLVGVLHMPFARSLLMKVGGCPIDRGTPQQIDEAMRAHDRESRALATSDAPMRPALGFTLEKTTPDEVRAWGASKGLACTDDLDGMVILCPDVPAAAIGQEGPNVAELQFDFHLAPKTLKIVSTFRQHLSRSDALTLVNARQAELKKELGEPAAIHGTPTLDTGSDLLAVYVVKYNFKDYLVDQNTAQLPSGFSIAEHYVSQRD